MKPIRPNEVTKAIDLKDVINQYQMSGGFKSGERF